jgi:hypothetical protein
LYPDYWAIIGDPRYLGYKTMTVAFEHSVEWVARAGRLMDGRIGTHMILWGPPRDSKV